MPTQRLRALSARPDRTALLVDFDGSLSPIVERADDARPLPDTLRVLERLAAGFGRVAIVSGRPVGFLARHLPVDGLALVGLYGMEQSIDGAYAVDPRVQPYLVAVAAATAELEAQAPARYRRTEVGRQRDVALAPGPRAGRSHRRGRARGRGQARARRAANADGDRAAAADRHRQGCRDPGPDRGFRSRRRSPATTTATSPRSRSWTARSPTGGCSARCGSACCRPRRRPSWRTRST